MSGIPIDIQITVDMKNLGKATVSSDILFIFEKSSTYIATENLKYYRYELQNLNYSYNQECSKIQFYYQDIKAKYLLLNYEM